MENYFEIREKEEESFHLLPSLLSSCLLFSSLPSTSPAFSSLALSTLALSTLLYSSLLLPSLLSSPLLFSYLYTVTVPSSKPARAISELLSGAERKVTGDVTRTLPVRTPDRE